MSATSELLGDRVRLTMYAATVRSMTDDDIRTLLPAARQQIADHCAVAQELGVDPDTTADVAPHAAMWVIAAARHRGIGQARPRTGDPQFDSDTPW